MASHPKAPSTEDYAEISREPVKVSALQHLKDNALLSTGVLGGLGILGFMFRGLKSKGKGQKLSVYMIHTRLAVQGTVVGVLTLGMLTNLYVKYQERHQHPAKPE